MLVQDLRVLVMLWETGKNSGRRFNKGLGICFQEFLTFLLYPFLLALMLHSLTALALVLPIA